MFLPNLRRENKYKFKAFEEKIFKAEREKEREKYYSAQKKIFNESCNSSHTTSNQKDDVRVATATEDDDDADADDDDNDDDGAFY